MLGGFVHGANKLQLLFFKFDANAAVARKQPTVFTDIWAPAVDGNAEDLR